jgi:hypothetical protein
VRHKILDAIGDLALVGVPIIGHLIARKPGHKLNNSLLRRLMENPDAWSYTTVDDINRLLGKYRAHNDQTADSNRTLASEYSGIAGTGIVNQKKDHA